MKKWKTVFMLAFLALAIVSFLVYRAMQGRGLAETTKRIYSQSHVHYVRSFPTSYHVAELQVYKGMLFLYNTTDMQIVQTDSLGTILKSFGKKGGGQGEFRLITSAVSKKLVCTL
jgi:hypothetical protein